jgi:hypothetical protein
MSTRALRDAMRRKGVGFPSCSSRRAAYLTFLLPNFRDNSAAAGRAAVAGTRQHRDNRPYDAWIPSNALCYAPASRSISTEAGRFWMSSGCLCHRTKPDLLVS